MPHHYGVQYCFFIKLELVLFQHSHSLPGCYINAALIGLNFTTEYFQKGTFSGTISADNTIAIPFCKIQIYIFKQNPFTVSQFQVFNTDHSIFFDEAQRYEKEGKRGRERNGKCMLLSVRYMRIMGCQDTIV